MKKLVNITPNYMLKKLYQEEFYYFDIKIFAHIFNFTHLHAAQWFKQLKKKGFIKEVEKGKYVLLGFEPHRVLAEPYFIATKVIVPSYISFWSALNFYGFTEQVPKTILIATTKKKKEIYFHKIRYKYIKVAPYKFFGYEEKKSGGLSYLMAEPEKALIDSLDQPSYAGGIDEIFKCLYNAKNEIKISKLISYAIQFNNKSLNSRLGFLLNKINIKAKKIKPYISSSFVKLDPSVKASNLWDKEWKININLSRKKLFSWQEIY